MFINHSSIYGKGCEHVKPTGLSHHHPVIYYQPVVGNASVDIYSNCLLFVFLFAWFSIALWQSAEKSCPLGFPLVVFVFTFLLNSALLSRLHGYVVWSTIVFFSWFNRWQSWWSFRTWIHAGNDVNICTSVVRLMLWRSLFDLLIIHKCWFTIFSAIRNILCNFGLFHCWKDGILLYKFGTTFISVGVFVNTFVMVAETSILSLLHMGQVMRKRVVCHMRTTKAQITLRIRAIWSASLLFAA